MREDGRAGKALVPFRKGETVMDNLREALEAALFEAPDDRATHAAYADFLTEQGDPRGEFISVQFALEDETRSPQEREALRRREANLMGEYGRAWLGELAPYLLEPHSESHPWCNDFLLARGWLDSLYLLELNPALAQALGQCPVAPLLRALAIRYTDYDRPGYEELARSGVLGNVRHFQIGDDDRHQARAGGAGLVPVIAGMARLEELALCAHSVDTDALFALPMPRLRSLIVYHLTHYPLKVLAANPSLARLEELRLWPHCLEMGDDPYLDAEGVSALVRSPHLTGLRRLRLYLNDMGDAGVDALLDSGILKRLKVLDLWNGRVTDAGARRLAACPDLRNLETLRLSQNQLTDEGIGVLLDTGIALEADDQWSPDEIEEGEHLFQGDIE
jgi:uncharacterized protein (TIGR02996 family)